MPAIKWPQLSQDANPKDLKPITDAQRRQLQSLPGTRVACPVAWNIGKEPSASDVERHIAPLIEDLQWLISDSITVGTLRPKEENASVAVRTDL